MRAGQLTGLVDALKTIMAGERAVYAGLAEVADQKKGYIIQNDLANITYLHWYRLYARICSNLGLYNYQINSLRQLQLFSW